MKRWNPVDYIGYSKDNGMQDTTMSSAMQKAVDDLKNQIEMRNEQEKLLGKTQDTSEDEKDQIRREMLKRIGG